MSTHYFLEIQDLLFLSDHLQIGKAFSHGDVEQKRKKCSCFSSENKVFHCFKDSALF